jgi:hypothetical protein
LGRKPWRKEKSRLRFDGKNNFLSKESSAIESHFLQSASLKIDLNARKAD